MQTLQNGQNTQRVISNDKLISDAAVKTMAPKKKVIIGVAIFFTIAAMVGIALGLQFHFRPNSIHLFTAVLSTNDRATTFSSTKFIYTDNNMIAESVYQTFTIMFAGLNGSQIQQRMLQTTEQQVNTDTTLHYTHNSGIKIKFRNNEILNISVPIDQVLNYIAQQDDPEGYPRLLQELSHYNQENETIQGSEFFNYQRSDLLESFEEIYPNTNFKMTDFEFMKWITMKIQELTSIKTPH